MMATKKFEDLIAKWKSLNEESIKILNSKGITYGDFLRLYFNKLNKLLDEFTQIDEPVKKKNQKSEEIVG